MNANPPLLLRHALVIDGVGGNDPDADLLVSDGRVARNPTSATIPKGCRVIDVGGLTVMPGLIDTHIHCAGGNFFPGYEDEPIELAVLRTAAVLHETLLAGITTVRTAASRDWLDIGVREAIHSGVVQGPRVLASGRGITITGGHMARVAVSADGSEGVRLAVRDHVRRGVDSIKLMLSAGVATGGRSVQASQFDEDEVRTAVTEAHRAGRRVLTHAIGSEAIKFAVAAGADSVDHGYYLDEETAVTMRKRGIFLVPTFSPGYYYTEIREAEPWRIERAEALGAAPKESFALALQTGVRIAMGSDCGAPSRMPNAHNALELELMVRAGMTEDAAIISGTSAAADLIGRPDLGRLSTGAVADIILVDGNPLDDIQVLQTSVVAVLQGGSIRLDRLDLIGDA